MFKIKFTTTNNAFCSPEDNDEDLNNYYRAMETVRILRKISDSIQNGDTYGAVLDFNGNKVGTWSFE